MPRYFITDFLRDMNIIIHPVIQDRALHPFTMQVAKIFFDNFVNYSFNFEGAVNTIIIYDGKENSPRHSYANGWLYKETFDELERLENLGKIPSPVGSITFEYGGTHSTPIIKIDKL